MREEIDMPRWYSDGLEAPPDDRGGGAIFIVLLAIFVAAIIIGSGWLSMNALTSIKEAGDAGKATAVAAAATATAASMPTPTAQPASAPTAAPAPQAAVLTVADWDLPNGHFFTQTNGAAALTSARGFAVTNEGGVPFWSEFQRLGGVAMIGYPLSARFRWNGLESQVFQRAIFQWNPTSRVVQSVNIMDELHNQGKDQWLFEGYATPKPLPPDFDRGATFAEVARGRMAILQTDPAMLAFYNAAPDPTMLYGLPASLITDMGSNYALRLQRGVLQRWKGDQPWARAGQVTAANSGQLAVQAGLIPAEALQPQEQPR
jgi:hypothetical protein